jgi:hypothetical protein
LQQADPKPIKAIYCAIWVFHLFQILKEAARKAGLNGNVKYSIEGALLEEVLRNAID